MTWTLLVPQSSWCYARTDTPADHVHALTLPGTWTLGPSLGYAAAIRYDQWLLLQTPPGPPVVGYSAWYDASQITGQADNTALATWADSSGNGNTLTQATPANRPQYYSSTAGKTVNGKPAVWFTQTAETFMAAAPFGSPIAQPTTVFVVAQDTGIDFTASMFDGFAHRQNMTSQGSAGGVTYIYALNVLNGPPGDNNLHCFTGVFNGASSSFIVDGATFNGNAGADSLDLIQIGDFGATNGGWNGPICEVILYASLLTGPQIASVYNYLKTKWGTP